MTNQEKLALISVMTDEDDQTVIAAYLAMAKQIIFELAYPVGEFPEEMPARYDAVHVEITVYLINKQGAEGEIVHLENGVSRHWDSGSLPLELKRRITPFASIVRGVSHETDEA